MPSRSILKRVKEVNIMAEYSWFTYTSNNADSITYQCAWCNNRVASLNGYTRHEGVEYNDFGEITSDGTIDLEIRICPECENPSIIQYKNGRDSPITRTIPSRRKKRIKNMPSGMYEIYDGVSACLEKGLPTASVILCRNLLVHIAVGKGAKEGDSFGNYLTHIEKEGYVPPVIKPVFEEVLRIGNKANHYTNNTIEISQEEAQKIAGFMEAFLTLFYEYQDMIQNKDEEDRKQV